MRTFNIFAFVLLLSFAACTKAPLQEEVILEEAPQALYEMPVSNEASLKLLENPENEDENRTNAHLHILAEALLEATQKHDFSDLIHTFVQRDTAYNEIVLADMVEEDASFAQALEAEFAILFDKEGVEKSSDTYLNSLNFDYGSTPYEAGLYIPNAKTADFRRKPHTAVGSDVAVEDALELKHGDHIVALAHVEGAVQHYLVHEQSAKESPMPLLIVNVHTDEAFNLEESFTTKRLPGRFVTQGDIPIHSYRLMQRFETSRFSEYFSRVTTYYAPHDYEVGGRNKIDKVHKDDIGRTFYPNSKNIHFTGSYYEACRGVAVVIYEHDGWASAKNVSVPAPVPSTGSIVVKCKMKRNHEYYHRLYIPNGQAGISSSSSRGRIHWGIWNG